MMGDYPATNYLKGIFKTPGIAGFSIQLPIFQSDIPKIALGSGTSNRPQNGRGHDFEPYATQT